MKYFKTAVTSIVLYVGHIAAINPQSAVCEASLYAGLSVLLPGVDLETPLQECLNDAQNYPAFGKLPRELYSMQSIGKYSCLRGITRSLRSRMRISIPAAKLGHFFQRRRIGHLGAQLPIGRCL